MTLQRLNRSFGKNPANSASAPNLTANLKPPVSEFTNSIDTPAVTKSNLPVFSNSTMIPDTIVEESSDGVSSVLEDFTSSHHGKNKIHAEPMLLGAISKVRDRETPNEIAIKNNASNLHKASLHLQAFTKRDEGLGHLQALTRTDEGLGESIDLNSEQSNYSPKLVDKFDYNDSQNTHSSTVFTDGQSNDDDDDDCEDFFTEITGNTIFRSSKRVTFL